MATDGSADSFWIKVLGGAFATVIAPILVAVGLKFTDKLAPAADPGAPDAVAPAASTPSTDAKVKDAVVTPVAASDSPPQGEAKPPAKPSASADVPGPAKQEAGKLVRLFNGLSLRNFYTYLGPPLPGAAPLGVNHDPKRTISVRDHMIHFSGEVEGGLVTEEEYENYRLVIEYKWGEQTWPPREALARSSGVLLHCDGLDGAVNQHWMKSVRCRIMEGDTGSLQLIGFGRHHVLSLTAEANLLELDPAAKSPKSTLPYYQFRPGAPLTTFSRGELIRLRRAPKWHDVKGFRGRVDLEKPHDEWNTLECICLGDKISIRLNGKLVNEARTIDERGHATLHRGRIMLQALKAEIYFREIQIQQLSPPGAERSS